MSSKVVKASGTCDFKTEGCKWIWIKKISDFMPEDAQTISKGCIRAKSGTVIEEIDRALIRQFDLLPVARKMVMEELANGQQN